ncbi:MAG: hypothetical protein DMG49_22675 [Acidobacteria bacterium]|nr:MAG: hypothetical protein DMG49_22675 [Acidobacteriota bacterium]
MDTEDDFEVRSNDFVDAVERVESAVARVEQAVKDKWSSAVIIGWIILAVFLSDIPGEHVAFQISI